MFFVSDILVTVLGVPWGQCRGAFKGFSTGEIANMRCTSEGTVKAQTSAIYRKAGVRGRAQLLSLFIDDLVREELLPARIN